MSVDIKVTVADAEYRQLLAIASRLKVQVHHLIELQVRRGLTLHQEEPQPPQAPAPAETPPPTTTKPRKYRFAGDADRQQMRDLHAQTLSDGEIARQLGFAQGTVSRHLRLMKLEPHFPRVKREATS